MTNTFGILAGVCAVSMRLRNCWVDIIRMRVDFPLTLRQIDSKISRDFIHNSRCSPGGYHYAFNKDFTMVYLEIAFQKKDFNKSSAMEGIHGQMLVSLSELGRSFRLDIFNTSWNHSRKRLRESRRLNKTCKNAVPRTVLISLGRDRRFGDNFAKELQFIPLSNDTVARRNEGIAEDVEQGCPARDPRATCDPPLRKLRPTDSL
ncbi:hypothetical protein TNCV_1508061 [Trichonephila clavipes]|nr:hypothetical protein TNCV_1508061 [Trichonephila clavipes]